MSDVLISWFRFFFSFWRPINKIESDVQKLVYSGTVFFGSERFQLNGNTYIKFH